MLKLRSRLFFIYSLFICAALGVLTIVINKNAHAVFSKMVTENIELRSKEIAASVSGFYDVFSGSFDVKRIEDAGMYFTHSGYIITLRDTGENIIWDARTCDMQECNKIINEIAQRMKNDHNLSGAMHIENFPIMSFGNTVGTVSVETYGPYFYSETDERFLSSLNRALFICALFMLFICAILSAFLAGAISKPIHDCVTSAGVIASGKFDTCIKIDNRIQELHDLSTSLKGMSASLLAANIRQKEFMQDVSHELRTPLTCLSGNIEAMIDGVWDRSSGHLDSCMEEVQRLTKLLDDLTTLSNIEWHSISGGISNQLNISEINLKNILQTTADNFQNAALKKGITIIYKCTKDDSPPVTFNADYGKIKQVLFNLVSNAIKYSDGGTICINGDKRHDGIIITVSDQGEGIPPDDLQHIFRRFYRCDKSRSRSTGGEGLGLAIAKAIVTAHNGTITVENGKDCGAVFTIVLPVK